MAAVSTKSAIVALRDTEKSALLTLLGDESPAVYEVVRDKILSCGAAARDWLRPQTLSSDPLTRRRAQEIIRHVDRQAADTTFLAFCLQQNEGFDIEQGAWLLARTQYPEINVEAYAALLDQFAGELRQRLEPGMPAHPLLNRINDFLHDQLGFIGNHEDYHDPDNSYLNRVLDRRTGNPINLSLVYLLLARRLSLPVSGIGLPGHFVCRYQSASGEVYIDPFNRGKLLTKADCVQYLVQGKYDLRDEYLSPITPRRMLARICGNLHQIYVRLRAADESTRFQRYLVALSR